MITEKYVLWGWLWERRGGVTKVEKNETKGLQYQKVKKRKKIEAGEERCSRKLEGQMQRSSDLVHTYGTCKIRWLEERNVRVAHAALLE